MLDKLVQYENQEVKAMKEEVKGLKKTDLGLEITDEEGNTYLVTIEDNKVKRVFSLGKMKQIKKMLNKM